MNKNSMRADETAYRANESVRRTAHKVTKSLNINTWFQTEMSYRTQVRVVVAVFAALVVIVMGSLTLVAAGAIAGGGGSSKAEIAAKNRAYNAEVVDKVDAILEAHPEYLNTFAEDYRAAKNESPDAVLNFMSMFINAYDEVNDDSQPDALGVYAELAKRTGSLGR